MKIIKKLALILCVLCVVGCSKFKIYEVPVEQGNQIDSSTIKELHLGMDKNEVAAAIGSPVLGDTFDDNAWSYIYTNKTNVGKFEKRDLELEFRNNKLVKTTPKI